MLGGESFTHVVELIMPEQEVYLRASEMRMTLHDGVVYSKWEREERAKLLNKPVNEDDDAADDIPDEEKPQPLLEEDMVIRPCDA